MASSGCAVFFSDTAEPGAVSVSSFYAKGAGRESPLPARPPGLPLGLPLGQVYLTAFSLALFVCVSQVLETGLIENGTHLSPFSH